MRKLLVLLAAGALVVGYTVPALAQADFDFYGTVRVGTFMHDVSKEASATGVDSDEDLTYTWDRSIFGVNVTAGDITGKFAYWQMYANSLMAKNQFNSGEAAEFWASWDFGTGSLLVGRNWVPVNVFISNQVAFRDIDLLLSGACFTDTRTMIQLSFGGLKLAAVEPEEGTVNGTVIPGLADTDATMPKLEVRYDFAVGNVHLAVFGGYNTYDETTVVAGAEKDYSIDSIVYGAQGVFDVGAFTIKASAYAGENVANYGVLNWGNHSAYYDAASDSIKDSDTLGYCIVLNYKASDTILLEAGYGYAEAETEQTAGVDFEDETISWYINAVITIAEGVTITPEIGVLDFKDSVLGGVSTEQGDNTYWGAKWQIDF
jgi:hypothetical protein